MGHYIDVENYFLMSDRYQRIGNKFKLLNPYKIYPALEGEKAGYTCKSHEDECEEMFSMLTYSNYDLHDGGRLTNFTKLEVSNDYYEKEVQLKEKLNLLDYYEEDELDNVFSTNPQVADIKNKKLEIYHVGSTDLIYEDNLNYKVIHLKVTDISDNPITKSTPIAFIVFIVVLIIILTNKKIMEK